MDKDLEIRNIGTIDYETREEGDSRLVEGYAIVFDSRSEDLGFYEVIEPGAVTQEMVDNSDVFALFNHNMDKVLARSKNGAGSLKLEVDARGLRYSFDAPKTDLGNELLEYIRRGDISGSSFAFYVDNNDKTSQTWERKNGTSYRTIHKIKAIKEISPVFTPAYAKTTVSQRSLDKCKELEMQEEQTKNDIVSKLDSLSAELNELTKI